MNAFMSRPKTAALIVAAGRGTRAGSEIPKQWRPIAGARVIDHTIARFRTHPLVDTVVVVISPKDRGFADSLQNQPDLFANGGDDRSSSVRNGLQAMAAEATWGS